MLKVSLHAEGIRRKDTYNLPERRQPSRNASLGLYMENWCELDLWSSSIEFYFAVSGNNNTKTYHRCISQFHSSFKRSGVVPGVGKRPRRVQLKMPHPQDQYREHMPGYSPWRYKDNTVWVSTKLLQVVHFICTTGVDKRWNRCKEWLNSIDRTVHRRKILQTRARVG